jgi:hypothetical protein
VFGDGWDVGIRTEGWRDSKGKGAWDGHGQDTAMSVVKGENEILVGRDNNISAVGDGSKLMEG